MTPPSLRAKRFRIVLSPHNVKVRLPPRRRRRRPVCFPQGLLSSEATGSERMRRSLGVVAVVLLALAGSTARADELPKFERKRDVIYGRKYGLALTMDVLTPEKPNGAAVIF